MDGSRRRRTGARGRGDASGDGPRERPPPATPGGGPAVAPDPPGGDPASALAGAARALGARLGEAAAGLHGEPPAALARAIARAAEDARALASAADALAEALRSRPGAGGRRRDAPDGAPPRPRLLVCEDDPEEREAIVEALAGEYALAGVGSGPEALRGAVADPPDLLLLDLRVPGLDGLEILAALRGAGGEVPVILLSGHADDATRVRALELGAVDVLQKPVSLRELRARIERALRHARSHRQLRAMAETDPLTGLANLRAFRARLEDEVRRARRYGTPLTCLMADMDHLKPVNDELGHAAGDLALAAMADVLRGELRASDVGARCGGDEFVLLLPHTTAREGLVLAERVCARLRAARLEAGGRPVPLRASFGVAELAGGPASEGPDALVRRADEALYAAKRAGRGQAVAHAGERGPAPPPGPALTA